MTPESPHPAEPRPAAPRGNCIIESLGIYMPERAVSTAEIVGGCRRPIVFPIETVTGIHHRRVAAAGEHALDLARHATRDCLAASRHSASAIDTVIACNISRYDAPQRFSFEPSTAFRLCHELGLQPALAFDLSNACAGMFTGVLLAETLIRSGRARLVLIVSGEHITHLMRTAQREIKSFLDPRLACLTLGDAGAALLLEEGPDDLAGLHRIELHTLGELSDACIARASDRPDGGAIMITDAVRLASGAVQEATRHAVEVQRDAGWPPDLLDHLIVHQTSERTIREAADRVNAIYGRTVCPDDKLIINVAERGNTATTSHMVAFADHAASGRIAPGDNIVFSINGSGLTIGTCVYKCDDLPARLRGRPAGGTAAPPGARLAAPPGASPATPWRPSAGCAHARIAACGVLPPAAGTRRTTLAMAAEAAETCLDLWGGDRAGIDALLFTGTYRTDYVCEPAVAAMLARELALNHQLGRDADAPRTLALDLLNGAGGPLMACQIAAAAIAAGRWRRVLIVAAEVENNAGRPGLPLLGLEETASALLLTAVPEAGFTAFAFSYAFDRIDAFVTSCDLGVPSGRLDIDRAPPDPEGDARRVAAVARRFLADAGVAPASLGAVLPPQHDRAFIAALRAELAAGPDPVTATLIDATAGRNDLADSGLAAAWTATSPGAPAAQGGGPRLLISLSAGLQIGCALHAG